MNELEVNEVLEEITTKLNDVDNKLGAHDTRLKDHDVDIAVIKTYIKISVGISALIATGILALIVKLI